MIFNSPFYQQPLEAQMDADMYIEVQSGKIISTEVQSSF